jgi:hypothetical protein
MEPLSSRFSRPTPLGCLAATVGLFLVGFAALAGWHAHLAFTKDPPMPEEGRLLLRWAIGFGVPGVAAILWGTLRVVRRLNVPEDERHRSGNTWID